MLKLISKTFLKNVLKVSDYLSSFFLNFTSSTMFRRPDQRRLSDWNERFWNRILEPERRRRIERRNIFGKVMFFKKNDYASREDNLKLFSILKF